MPGSGDTQTGLMEEAGFFMEAAAARESGISAFAQVRVLGVAAHILSVMPATRTFLMAARDRRNLQPLDFAILCALARLGQRADADRRGDQGKTPLVTELLQLIAQIATQYRSTSASREEPITPFPNPPLPNTTPLTPHWKATRIGRWLHRPHQKPHNQEQALAATAARSLA